MAAFSASFRRRQAPASTTAATATANGDIRPRLGESILHSHSPSQRHPRRDRLPSLQTSTLPKPIPQPSSQHSSSSTSSTSFFGSQLGGQSVINYSYTDLPWKLLAYDVYHFFRLAWALPYIVWPLWPADSGPLAELSPTLANIWCISVHAVLAVLQLVFLVGLVPAACLLPVWVATGLVLACLGVNHVLCTVLLNGIGGAIEYRSRPECAPALPQHAHEQWVFLNGVAVGQHRMQSNLDRLALTFKRPILGIHNKTSGILFDVIECLVQRNYTYATRDVRVCYGILKETLYRPDITKAVFILHSQGGIEGGLVLDWLLQELPQDMLAKLEVYTFGNAANHFNNPHRTVDAQNRELAAFGSMYAEPETAEATPTSATPATPIAKTTHRTPLLVAESSAVRPAALTGQAIGHIEHYAHTTDFVALWGVLHFVSSVPKTRSMPRFLGRVFARASPRGGHQFCQHYLDGMFPLARDPATNAIVGCAETGNAFMESEVEVARAGDESAVVHEAFERNWQAATNGASTAAAPSLVAIHASSPILARQASQPRPIKVKDVSRLWQYRNGRSPDDGITRGLSRFSTL
ncbi:uncharacterized protein SPSK_01604 [Sporothrix schenckii 1099-18]|uniref:Uncharacterized protein n=1 Tax=Sporothrix schenckii 1099-18 TaxID=1397361 RepID=A0A0F2MF36_SPOSC|nr:uncharacterized protein SPSK_01604 [Sporothrix schenckii 1099-18]KJR87435.1 hypothetical protein SPSK_01604 [Sporothrix schenckii 1099-18]